jgi:hypothetical protein
MAVLALVALGVVLLRPLCDALEPIQAAAAAPSSIQQDHDAPGEPCCASIGEGSMAPSSSAIAFLFDGPQEALPALVPLFAPRVALPRASLDPPRRPPRAVPFHARTARILA